MLFKKHIAITIVCCLGLGFLLGVLLSPNITKHRIRQTVFELKNTDLLSDSLCDFTTGQKINILDTITKREKNLLVFWAPTCIFSKAFFSHQLNEHIVGIYCFPMERDLEYLRFYIEKHHITLPQVMVQKSDTLVPVFVPSIVATPTFVIVDNKGERLAQYVGINEIEEMIAFLYQ